MFSSRGANRAGAIIQNQASQPARPIRIARIAMRAQKGVPSSGLARSSWLSTRVQTNRTKAITASQPGYGGAREGRAAGGAVNLMALANMARKAVTKSTENLLRAPDEHVVKALEVANRQI